VDDRLISEDEQTGGHSLLSAQAQLALYRTAQESLTNILKHAKAATAEVRLEYRDNAPNKDVVLTITDHPGTSSEISPPLVGIHLSSEAIPTVTGGGQGLVNLHQRLAAVGGSLQAGPDPDGGFIVRARIPTETSQSTFTFSEVS
jgi:histidine kinase